ncbi:MAG TPA: glutamate synthase subunit beta [Gaiellales bacterium]|jgi:glutamate synthase (NADPH/NADH) small chain
MTDPRGFLQIQRRLGPYRPVAERIRDYDEQHLHAPEGLVREQAQRCMDCGVPFCHNGCPLSNLIPEWNDLVHRGEWLEASARLHRTNNFPEFTGKLCPAPCEEACVLTINDDAVAIKEIELAIAERALAEGWVVPEPPSESTGRSIGIVGSGPAGLACAQQLARAGHAVTVYERDDRAGGLLRFGIPDYKLEKRSVDLRIEQLEAEGVSFVYSVEVGVDLSADELRARHDAVVLATGAQRQRDITLPGRELDGIHLAMPYLIAQNRRVAGLEADPAAPSAAGKRVAILGAGDTSADCLGNVIREGAASVIEIAHGPLPPGRREPLKTWPEWPALIRNYPVHEEGGSREWQIETVGFEGADGRLAGLRARRVDYPEYAETRSRRSVPVEDLLLDVDLVLLAIGFVGIQPGDGLAEALGIGVSTRGTIETDGAQATSADGVFACGDCVRGADLIVTAIAEGRRAAAAVERSLMRAPAPTA